MDKKFIITVAISILIALGFVGCGAKQKDTTSSEPAQTLGVTTVTSSEVENTVPKGNPTETSNTTNSSVATHLQTKSKEETSSKNSPTVNSNTQATETTHPQIKDGMDMIEEAIREALKK